MFDRQQLVWKANERPHDFTSSKRVHTQHTRFKRRVCVYRVYTDRQNLNKPSSACGQEGKIHALNILVVRTVVLGSIPIHSRKLLQQIGRTPSLAFRYTIVTKPTTALPAAAAVRPVRPSKTTASLYIHIAHKKWPILK